MTTLFDRAASSSGRKLGASYGGSSIASSSMASTTTPNRLSSRLAFAAELECTPGPGAYEVVGLVEGSASRIMGPSAAFKGGTEFERSLVHRDAASLPGVMDYNPKRVELDRGTAAGFKSKEQRFKPTDQQKTTTDAYASYSQDHGTMMAAAAKASENRSAAFASGTSGRSSWLPTDPREKQRALREAQEREERKRAWEEYQQELREADPEWQAAEAARLAAVEAERIVVEKAARDARERVVEKEQKELHAAYMAARAAEEWAWRQAEEEMDKAEGAAKMRTRHEQRRQRLQSVTEETEETEEGEESEEGEEGEEGEGDAAAAAESDAAAAVARIRQRKAEMEREERIAGRAAELVAMREEQRCKEAEERSEAAAVEAGRRAVERVRQKQEAEQREWESRRAAHMAAMANYDAEAEAAKVAMAAMTAANRAKALQEAEREAERVAAERAAWQLEEDRRLAALEREVRQAYEEARAAEKARLDAEEKVRRRAEAERQRLAVQDWSWHEAMEMAWDQAEKVEEKLRQREQRITLGAVKSRQKLAEQKSLARSQMSQQLSSTGRASAAFASTTGRDSQTESAMKYVNPEQRAKQRTHERMVNRSNRRAKRLNECAVVLQAAVRRRLGRRERTRLERQAELHVHAPPLQALVRGWRVRSRLRWCFNIAVLQQRHIRGHLARRRVAVMLERMPRLQAAVRGLLARASYRRHLEAATALQAGARGLAARRRARGLRCDPTKVAAASKLRSIRTRVETFHRKLGELASLRSSEQAQLKLALNHEMDKLGAGAKDAPHVMVMRQQERLAISDALQIAKGREKTSCLLELLASIPFARAADALAAVAPEVAWLDMLVDEQQRRDELYRPDSHRAHGGASPPAKLSRDEQLDSYRAVRRSPSAAGHSTMGARHGAVDDDEPNVDPVEAAAVEAARRLAARRAREGMGVATLPAPEPKMKKWMGKGPPPPGWNKVMKAPPMPANFTPSKKPLAVGKPCRPMYGTPAVLGPGTPNGADRPKGAFGPRAGSPRPPVAPGGPTPAKPKPAHETPTGAVTGASTSCPASRAPSPVPSLNMARDVLSSARTSTSGSQRSMTPSARSSARTASPMASGRSSVSGGQFSSRSVSSNGSARPKTQKDFEENRLDRMARAQAAQEQKKLEAAKRAAQRSKRVAGLMINPEKIEEQKRERAREAAAKLRSEREAAEREAAEAIAAREMEADARKAHAAVAGAAAQQRLRERKAERMEEQRRQAEALAEQQLEAERAAEEQRRQKAEQRRLRNETSFFARAVTDGVKAERPMALANGHGV